MATPTGEENLDQAPVAVQFRASKAPELMAQAWRLRYRVFNDKLGWPLPDIDLLEIDEFDSSAAHAALLQGGGMIGYVRALPTTSPYLLSRHFAHLLNDKPPADPGTCEISRFAVHPACDRNSGIQRQLIREGVALARSLGANQMIAVIEPPFERLLKSCGLHITRLCAPQAVGVGRGGAVNALVIACDVDFANLSAVGLADLAA